MILSIAAGITPEKILTYTMVFLGCYLVFRFLLRRGNGS
jgi:hypothetical protein